MVDKKQAHYLAKLAARETYRSTLQKLAGDKARETDLHGNPTSDWKPVQQAPHMKSKEDAKKEKARRMPNSNVDTRVDLGFADTKEEKDDKCPECGCACDGEVQSKKASKLMSIAAAYAKDCK